MVVKKEVSAIVNELSQVLDSFSKSNLDINANNDVLDFKASKANILKKKLDEHYKELLKEEALIRKYKYNEILAAFDNIKTAYGKKDVKELKREVMNLCLLLPTHKELKLDVEIPTLPPEIKPELAADITEINRCFLAGCYRSAVVLCGRILETALHRKYYEQTGNDILETNPAIGLGKLIAKLSESNVKFPPGITEQIHLINKIRISSVHKKKQVFIPSKEQANAIILYTLDVLKQMF